MDKETLKRMLAGLSIAGLLSGAGILVSPPDSFGASSWTDKKDGAGGTEVSEEKAPEGKSSWTGDKSGAVSAEEKKDKEKEKEEKPAGKSSWTQ